MMIALIAASGIAGGLLGRYFKVYALLPAIVVIAALAYYVGSEQGFWTGVISFGLSAVAMQGCYFVSFVLHATYANLASERAPSEHSVFL